ncbi:MAG: filamentous hemagglutinin N-terminal domain-containing protein [Iphinoe sp. HA4291-MV1]|jgi:filamentous hemagglutinin family protein|nr:filamentous hemagglutinin N-terminal domain-containing protein [Iphinoe sp. HA4291-MV1]
MKHNRRSRQLRARASRSVRKARSRSGSFGASLFLITLPLCTIGSLTSINTVTAQQVTSDGTVSTTVTTPDGRNFNINDGTRRGGNLFHSFKDFSVPTGGSANFNNAADVRNIISRVTGGSVSTIDGLIRALGNANLFLLNPAGIIFGPNASLNIGGSFLATTANSFVFDNGFEFSATNPQAPPLLTINIPNGLRFRDNPASIQVQGSQLEVGVGQNLTLSGGDINIQGKLQAQSGSVTIDARNNLSINGAVDVSAKLFLAPNGQLIPNSNGGDVRLTAGGGIVTQPGTAIESVGLLGGNITLNSSGDIMIQPGTAIGSVGLVGGNLTLNSSGNLAINNSIIDSISSGNAPGNLVGGNIELSAKSIALTNFARIINLTTDSVHSGNINVKAKDTIEIVSTNVSNISQPRNPLVRNLLEKSPRLSNNLSGTGLGIVTTGTGNAGDINIKTRNLMLRNDSGILTGFQTFKIYPQETLGGNITVNADESIEIVGNRPGAFTPELTESAVGTLKKVPTGITTSNIDGGVPGNITINTGRLIIRNGAAVVSGDEALSSEPKFNGGTVTVNATDFVELQGQAGLGTGTLGNRNAGNLIVNVPKGKISLYDGAFITADTLGSGNAGQLTIKANELFANNGSRIGASTAAQGSGGIVTIEAKSVELVGTSADGRIPSGIFTSTTPSSSGNGGDLSITTEQLTIRDGAQVTASSFGTGNAGNILNITARNLTLDKGSITTTSLSGNGGNIENLQVQDLLLLRNQSLISTTAGTRESGGGDGGKITINAKDGFVVAFPNENSDITANAFGGSGGTIKITAEKVFGLEVQEQLTDKSDITAFSEQGPDLSGQIILNTPNIDPSQGLIEFSETVIDPTQQIAQNPCLRGGGEFTITGRGGFPTNPSQILGSDNVRVDLVKPVASSTRNSTSATKKQRSSSARVEEIVPARGWIFNEKGQVVLVAYDPTKTGVQREQPTPASCAAR